MLIGMMVAPLTEFSIANFPSHTYQNAGTYYVSITGTASEWTGASTVENGQGTEILAWPPIWYGSEKGYWPWIKAIVSWGDLGPGLTHIDLAGSLWFKWRNNRSCFTDKCYIFAIHVYKMGKYRRI